MSATNLFINVNTDEDLNKVADAAVQKTGYGDTGRVSIVNQRGGLKEGEVVAIEFFESEGTEPLAVETKFKIAR